MDSIFNPSVAIILVNWNGYLFTKACIKSLEKIEYNAFQIILVDNGSENFEGQKLKKEFPEIELIENGKNLGFAGGNNVGIRRALEDGFSYVMLLNNDTEVEPNFLEEMISKFQSNPKLGMVQPLIFFLHDRNKIWSAGGRWNSFLGRAITVGDRKMIKSIDLKDSEIDWATGCCILISKEALEQIGLLNEQYFTYFEDVDWSLRLKDKGYKIELASAAKIYHEAGASSKKKHSEGTLSASVFYFHVRNQFFLLRDHLSGIPFCAGLGYHGIRFFTWMVYFCFRGRFQKLKAVARGIHHGLFFTLEETK